MEKYFRELETNALKTVITKHNIILSCGGGAPLAETNQRILKTIGTIVYLDADIDVLRSRLSTGGAHTFFSDNRNQIFTKLARIRISIKHESPEEIADKICNILKKRIINGETKIIGFMGSTYKTSKMFGLYNAAFEALHLNFVYIPLVVTDVQKAVEGIRNLGISAVGITIPYKTEIVPFLDELDTNAQRIGAVNAIVNRNGRLFGHNTDGEGAILALKEQTVVQGKRVVLLGAGGVARALVFALKDNGADITILNRSGHFDTLDALPRYIKNADILINATSVGMEPNIHASLVPKDMLRPDLVVLDVVSNQETQLLKDARMRGARL